MVLVPETTTDELDIQGAREAAKKREFLINLVRTHDDSPLIWAAFHALVSSKNVPVKRVGFVPVVPYPITQRSVVRKCMTNFVSVCQQLEQDVLPLWSDEGAFNIVVDIFLHEPETFKTLFPCMGPFHWSRVLLRCAGKLLKGTGFDDAMVECDVFRPVVIESALNGTHYARALSGILIVEDVMTKMVWQAFWGERSKEDYDVFKEIEVLQGHIKKKQRCPEIFEGVLEKIGTLIADYEDFIRRAEEKSELCKYLGQFLKIVGIIKNNVAAEREGNWSLHVAVTGDSIPIFCEFDCLKYVKSGSWYFERIKALEITHPYIFRRFMLGQWSIRETPGWFKAVGADMRLEQSVQRVSKGPGGHFVVGATHKINVVSEFELIYHEIGSICTALNTVTSNQSLQHQECHLQHTFSPGRQVTVNKSVARLLDFTLKRHNPFIISFSVLLHNPFTKVAVDRAVADRLLNCIENGEKVWQKIREQRFVNKSVKLFASMTTRKLPCFNQQNKPSSEKIKEKSEEVSSKDLASAYMSLDLCKDRGMSLPDIMSCDLLKASPLFQGDLPFPPTKSKMMEEIESNLPNIKLMGNWDKNTGLKTAIMTDFMSKIRQLPFKDFDTLEDVLKALMSSSINISYLVQSVHFLFDSYVQFSLKDSERLRRLDGVEGLDIIEMDGNTPVPVLVDRFWASELNKENIQLLFRNSQSSPDKNIDVIFSSMIIDGELISARSKSENIPKLDNWLEEADFKVIPHIEYALKVQKCERIIVLSNDTDTAVVILHFMKQFFDIGLKELWIQYGNGENRRMIPMHDAYYKFGPAKFKSIHLNW